jgi:hypothetical protein
MLAEEVSTCWVFTCLAITVSAKVEDVAKPERNVAAKLARSPCMHNACIATF